MTGPARYLPSHRPRAGSSPLRGVGAALLFVASAMAGAGGAVAQEWQAFAVPEEAWSIDFPREPLVRDIAEMRGAAIAFFHDYRTIIGEGAYIVDVIEFTPAVVEKRSAEDLIGFAVEMLSATCEASVPREIPAAKGVAREVTFRCENEVTMRTRFEVVAPRLYQVSVAGGPGFLSGPDTTRFFDSLRIE
jgi:hypothetical protein